MGKLKAMIQYGIKEEAFQKQYVEKSFFFLYLSYNESETDGKRRGLNMDNITKLRDEKIR